MLNDYTRLLTPFPGCVAEDNETYQFLTERHIQALWYDNKLFESLKTSDNLPITILSPGIWNTEAGPDFLKAHLKIGETEFKGDVEIHLRDNSWKQHGHHTNPAYNQVILHLAVWKPKKECVIETAEGRSVARAYVESSLSIPLEQIPANIDLELYPYKTHTGTGKCGQKLFPHLSIEKTEDFLTAAAEWRISQKRRALSLRIDDPNMQFAAGVAMALGYKNNSEAFLQLFLRLHKMRSLPEHTLFALAMGGCGFFEPESKERWKHSDYYQSLEKLFYLHKAEAPQNIELKLSQVRPLNHPIRRIAYLIKWIRDPRLENYLGRILSYWTHEWARCYTTRRWTSMHEGLEAHIPEYDDPHWFSHYTFEEKKAGSLLPLIGSALKREILVNVIIPFIHHAVATRGSESELKAFYAFYSSLRSSPKGKTQYLTHRFFGVEEKGKLLNKAVLEQGAYQLHRDFCTHFEASCEGCPFVERFQEKSHSRD